MFLLWFFFIKSWEFLKKEKNFNYEFKNRGGGENIFRLDMFYGGGLVFLIIKM